MSPKSFAYLINILFERYLGIGEFQQGYRAALDELLDAYDTHPPFASDGELRAWVQQQLHHQRIPLLSVTGEPDPALAGRLQAHRDLLILLA